MRVMLSGNDWKLTGYWKNQWRFLRSMELGETMSPAVATIAASVPGAVQVDLRNANLLEDPNLGLNSNMQEWVNNREWIYEKEFTLPEGVEGDKFILVFEGLDYSGVIFLNGEEICNFSGMFKPVEIDITEFLHRNRAFRLAVVLYQAPEVDGQYGFTNQIRHLKSRFNYVWDWCPRMLSVGIWKDVYLKVYKYARITDAHPKTSFEPESGRGKIALQLEVDALIPDQYSIETVICQDDREIYKEIKSVNLPAAKQQILLDMELEHVEAWWPNGLGNQKLYSVYVSLIHVSGAVCDSVVKRVGFRKVEFIRNKGAMESAAAYTMVVNQSCVFIRGINWVPISPYYGAVTRDEYKNYLQRLRDMNCNLVRVWGGAILEKEDFYDICDEMGILVWQEFPQSSSGINNTPPDDPLYLAELKVVASLFIKEKRHHACHIIWCGGNELMWEDGKPVDERHTNIKMLKELVESMDSGKHFVPTSASGPTFIANKSNFGKGLHHDVHGPWNYLGEIEHYDYFNKDDSLFRSETGCPGTARIETLEKNKTSYSLWPPDKSNPFWTHRGAWWLQLEQLTALFGEWAPGGEEMEAYVKASRYLQAEALRYAVEAARRREPVCSGFIIWMGNEPFPNNANTSIIEYDGTPKPAYYWVANAYSDYHVSAKYDKLAYTAGETFTCEVYISCDSSMGKKAYVTGQILDMGGNVLLEKHWETTAETGSTKVGVFDWKVRPCSNDIFFLRLTFKAGSFETENTYIYTVDSLKHPLLPLRKLPAGNISIHETASGEQNTLIIRNDSDVAAVNLFLYGKEPEDFVRIYPNYFTLMPKEVRKISYKSDVKSKDKDITLNIIGDNV